MLRGARDPFFHSARDFIANLGRRKVGRRGDGLFDSLLIELFVLRGARLLAEVEEDAMLVVRRGRKIPPQSWQQPPFDERMKRGERGEQQRQRNQIATPPEPINKGRAAAGQRHQQNRAEDQPFDAECHTRHSQMAAHTPKLQA
jgi:hypothetical protein